MGRVGIRVGAIILGLNVALTSPSLGQSTSALSPGVHQVVVNDVRLWYRVAGRTTGRPVIFIHGGPGEGSQSFAMIAGPALERSNRMVYLDQRGSGRSERPWTKAYSLDLLVDDLEKLRQKLGVPKLALVGHSAGTLIEMEYAAKYPSHVDRMVLAASGPDLADAFNRMCDRVAKTDPAAFARARAAVPAGSSRRCNMWADHVFGPGGMQQFVDSNMFPRAATQKLVEAADNANGLRNTGELSSALIRQGMLDYRFTKVGRLTMPVLVIAGEKDFQAALEPQRVFAAKLPKGRFSAWKDSGHFMWAEDPERFAREVNAFLNN